MSELFQRFLKIFGTNTAMIASLALIAFRLFEDKTA